MTFHGSVEKPIVPTRLTVLYRETLSQLLISMLMNIIILNMRQNKTFLPKKMAIIALYYVSHKILFMQITLI